MINKYTFSRSLPILMLIMIGVSSCTDELTGLEINTSRPSDVICFTASLSDTRSASQTRGTSGHLEIEQEEWLVGTEQSVTRGVPVTLLEGSAGVIGYVYDTWQENAPAVDETPATTGTLPTDALYNKEFKFDGDELSAASDNVRWATLKQSKVRFYAYAPYDPTGRILSSKEQGGSPQLTYTVNETPANQHDLIVASWEGQSDYKQSIPLVFDHALTAVRFKVGFDCIVTKLEVQNVYNSGTYAFDTGWSVDMAAVEGQSATTSYSFIFDDKQCKANDLITDGKTTLMMIPQTLPAAAKVILTYKETSGGELQTINATIGGKVWQEGKMITYTIHKTSAPTTIYFDLAAGNVELGKTATTADIQKEQTLVIGDMIYKGYIYVGGVLKDVIGKHSAENRYYIYQSSEAVQTCNTKTHTGYATEAEFAKGAIGECRIPNYAPVKLSDGTLWKDYITNNTSVEDVIETWDDGNLVREDGQSASCEKDKLKNIKVVRDVGRTHTLNHIYITNKDNNETEFNVVIDNIYSTYQHLTTNKLRIRSNGGISYRVKNKTKLTINLVGDNRLGYVDIKNKSTDYIIFEGTGSLTVANTDFLTVTDMEKRSPKITLEHDYFGTTDEQGYLSNHRKSAIGNDTDDSNGSYMGHIYNLTFNSGTIFAGTTQLENCSAIGGGGNGYGSVFINGGTVTAVATTTGSAIGGGIGFKSNGGKGEVQISGGNVYAYNRENIWGIPSSAIGGAGSQNSYGSDGEIYISGGYVYAYSALGTAIGAGSSKNIYGGSATITITGGQIIAKSGTGAGIGGGSSRTIGTTSKTVYNGGSATVNILGNPIIRTGSIGGGTTGHPKGKLGSANINVSGGDIQAQFVMEAGSTVTPTFEMSGGTIRNSYVNDNEFIHTKKFGGAVYLEDGTFTMSGGTIKNCSAVQGGAVYIARKSTEPMPEGQFNFKMEGGEIHSCFATGGEIGNTPYLGHGGAICLDGGQINMWGGRIWNNYSENGDGGAVYISNGNFVMTHSSPTITDNYPTITGNAAQKGNGGGVYVSSENGKSVQVDLLQGIITNNTANNYGGGICVDMGDTENAATVTVGANGQGVTESNANPKISGNMAMMSGGGLYVRGTNANVTINSGKIAENKVSAYVKNQDVANEMGGVTLNAGLVTHVVVTFNGNGGTVNNDNATTEYTQNIVTNTNSKLAPNRFVRAGHTFTGWNTRADGLGDSYSEGDAKPHSSDITLYAQWVTQ